MKMVTYRSAYSIVDVDTSVAPVPHPEIEILKKTFLDLQMKMVAYRFGHRVGDVDTSAATVLRSEIEITQKNFFGLKYKNSLITLWVQCSCR